MHYHNKIIINIWFIVIFLLAGVSICDCLICSSVTKQFGIKLISTYQKSVSPFLSKTGLIHCKYEVTCSEYTKQMIVHYGLLKGSLIGFKRILSCK
mgnify:CR=1 FL=1|jgi:putative component of membrane protein insertase Oxa1/YidC/SpoIIIJ protein YidD